MQDGHHTPSHSCAHCGTTCAPWFTTCPVCEFPVRPDGVAYLTTQPAAPLPEREQWIDIPVGSDEPVKAALLRSFLTERHFTFEESRRFISVPASSATAIAQAISIWAFHQELPDDDRHLDTLSSTLRDIGTATLDALHRGAGTPYPRTIPPRAGSNDLDLR